MILSAHSTSDTKILGLPKLGSVFIQVGFGHASGAGTGAACVNRYFLRCNFRKRFGQGWQPTGTTALATDLRISETASPRRKI